jgi:Tfp pilus assembly protein PilZ
VLEKRSHARVPLEIPIVCEPKGAAAFSATSKDISIGGMYVDSAETPSFGAELVIVALLPGAKQEVRLPAVVRWVKPGGFGVQFGLLGAVETHLISELMRG